MVDADDVGHIFDMVAQQHSAIHIPFGNGGALDLIITDMRLVRACLAIVITIIFQLVPGFLADKGRNKGGHDDAAIFFQCAQHVIWRIARMG